MSPRLRHLAELSPRDWLVLGELVLRAAWLRWRSGRPGFLTQLAPCRLSRPARRLGTARFRSLADAASRVVSGPGPCLVRSVLAWSRGHGAILALGVRLEGGGLRSHAWIEGMELPGGDYEEILRIPSPR